MDRAGIFREIESYFLQPERLERIRVFTRSSRQVEGWFKGELLYLFDSLLTTGKISEWAPEVPVSPDRRQKCDFQVTADDGRTYLELKTLFHGRQRGQPVSLSLYFPKSPDGVGITDDVVKLLRVSDGHRYLLLFVYPRPDSQTWATLMDTYRRRIAPISVSEETRVHDYPPELYICRLAIEGGF